MSNKRAPMQTGKPNEEPFSVLLLYPDYIADTFGHETFYAWVWATDADDAVMKARKDAQKTNRVYENCGEDFHPLLVLRGHQYGCKIND